MLTELLFPYQQIAVMAKLFESIGKLGLALAIGGGIVNSALFNGGSHILCSYYFSVGHFTCFTLRE